MRRFCSLVCAFALCAAAQNGHSLSSSKQWQAKVDQQLPLLGHRNWILIVDSAYPLQVAPGVETIETNADQLVVLKDVLQRVSSTTHVRPIIFEDQELSFVPEQDAPGVTSYRNRLKELLGSQSIQRLPHEQIRRGGKDFPSPDSEDYPCHSLYVSVPAA